MKLVKIESISQLKVGDVLQSPKSTLYVEAIFPNSVLVYYPENDYTSCRPFNDLIDNGYQLQVEGKPWAGGINEKYWFLSDSGVYSSVWVGRQIDQDRQKFFGIYQTEGEVLKMFDKVKEFIKNNQS